MSGYTPLYDTLLTGTLYGKWPHVGVWACLLSRVSREGAIDERPEMLAAMMGIDVDVLLKCIHDFMQPDPGSRTKTHDGRRLALLDPDRDWGWKVLNHSKYREKARKKEYDTARTESGVDAERKKASREVPKSPAISRDVPLSESESKAETKTERTSGDGFLKIKAAYPKFSGRQNWIMVELHCVNRINDGASWADLEAGTQRYAKFIESTGQHVLNPVNFFSGADEPWKQAWTLPAVIKPQLVPNNQPYRKARELP